MRLQTRLTLSILPLAALPLVMVGTILFITAAERIQDLRLSLVKLELTLMERQAAAEYEILQRLGLTDSVFYADSSRAKARDYARSRETADGYFFIFDGAGRVVWSRTEAEKAPTGIVVFPQGDFVRVEVPGIGPMVGYSALFAPWDWTIFALVPEEASYRDAFAILLPGILIFIGGMAATFVVLRLVSRAIARPVESLASATVKMSRGDFHVRAEARGNDEIAVLSHSFNEMAARLQESRSVLEETVRRRTEELMRAQDALINEQKLAALGGLVAGVSHEVNTPLGVSLTAASYLSHTTAATKRALEEGSLGKRGLNDYIAAVEEASASILRNMSNARSILGSFKELAVDQQADARRGFELGGYLEDILETLKPSVKRSPVELALELAGPIPVDTNPGAVMQVVSNLFLNSLVHAFPDGQAGHIRIVAYPDGEDAVIEYSDDGVGMEAAVKDRIFEPFFTTRRNAGGTGLGMSIVQNAVIGTLGGSISFDSSPGKGVQILVRFPRGGKKS